MYITGGIGSTVRGEAFTLDYDLPNDTMYCETCASIGLIFFAKRMLAIEAKGEYADVMERALYNTALAGMALDGKHFFYVNPLEAVPEKSEKDPGKSHVKCVRPQWLGCACCPPNLARLLASLEDYIYTVCDQKILINLFIQSELQYETADGTLVLQQETDYPQSGSVAFEINNATQKPLTIGIRIPGWTDLSGVRGIIDGKEQDIKSEDGFWYIEAQPGVTKIQYEMELIPRRWYANSRVSADMFKTAIARGPQVYCLEEVDNGKDLHCVSLPHDAELNYEWRANLLGGVGTIQAKGIRFEAVSQETALYTDKPDNLRRKETDLQWIPYYAWANRGKNEMRVWISEL